MLFNWAWLLDQPYRMAWRRYAEPSNTMASYEGFYFDPYDTNALGWVWVGTIRIPVNTDGARNMQGFEGFAEAYGGNTNQVREIDIRNVWLLDLSNQWDNITAANWTDARDPAVLTPIGGGWRHRCFDSNDVFTAANNIPMLPASDLAPIFLPYRINCGWGSTNVATGTQVAASLNRAFEPDAFWYGLSATNYTASPIDILGVTNAAPATLYQSRREGTNFGYNFFGLQPNAPSLTRLHFVETDFNATGVRLQNVLINGVVVDTNLDIRALSGAKNRALVCDYLVNVSSDGLVNISFQSQTPGIPAVVSGIELTGLLPQLAWHPQSVTELPGATAQFSVTAVGTPPLTYQWLKNSIILVGQTNTTLTLTDVTTNDASTYTIVVSNAYGSITSAPAILGFPQLFTNAPTLSNMVSGISQIIVAGGTPGPIVAMITNWIPIAGGDSDTSVPSTF
ncbi:MAG: malectin domain-containing carbohydrate-binding protein, partial [Verrucomicrobiota bacterium]